MIMTKLIKRLYYVYIHITAPLRNQIDQITSTAKSSDQQPKRKQSKELIVQQQPLQESVLQLQRRLTIEQQKIYTLQKEHESLKSSLEAEKLKVQSLEAKCDNYERLWAISRDEINFSDKILGTGGWGYVKAATFRGRQVAAKFLHEAIVSPHNQELFAKEMKTYAQCRHKNLVEFIGAVPEHPAIIIIEMMDCTLRFALSNGKVIPNYIHPICIDVAQGLLYLHSIQPHPLIHRDVSASNVLLKAIGTTEGWIAKLSDLGSAQFSNVAQTQAPGCVLYSAPEVQQRDTAHRQTEKIDVYSYGVLLIEILTREMPIKSLTELINSIQQTQPQFTPLISQCTNIDPTRRPTMSEVISSLNAINI